MGERRETTWRVIKVRRLASAHHADDCGAETSLQLNIEPGSLGLPDGDCAIVGDCSMLDLVQVGWVRVVDVDGEAEVLRFELAPELVGHIDGDIVAFRDYQRVLCGRRLQ